MLMIKYKIKRNFENKKIYFSLSNNNDYIFDQYRFDPFINESINENINNIIDGDVSIFKSLNNEKVNFYFGELHNNNITYFFENNFTNNARKSFFILDLFDNYKQTNRNKLFEIYLSGIPENIFEYNIKNIEIPNNIEKNTLYGRFAFFNSKDGKLYPMSHNNVDINNELDVLFEIYLDFENKTFELTKTNFYEIINDIYNNKEQNTITNIPNKIPVFPDGKDFVVEQNNIRFI